MKKNNVLFIDVDDCLIESREAFPVFETEAITTLKELVRKSPYRLVLIIKDQQDAPSLPRVGRGRESGVIQMEKNVNARSILLALLQSEKILYEKIVPETSAANDFKKTISDFINKNDISTEGSYLIASGESQRAAARSLHLNTIHFGGRTAGSDDEITAADWPALFRLLRYPNRKGELRRKTNETDIFVSVDLDGSGQSQIDTGIGFLDHMLELFARHGQMDLTVEAKGDLHVDEHHTTEDVALTLGAAFKEALSDKRGIGRYGFLLPMDESLAQVAIDLSGRSHLEWNADFKREKIGDLPTELFVHFFKSFADAAGLTLHIRTDGKNEHHKIEAIFKAVARALAQAVKRSADDAAIPSTKGSL